VFLVTDRAKGDKSVFKKAESRWSRFELHPDAFVPEELKNVLRSWLELGYEFRKGKPPAWAYGQIEPRILIESLVSENSEELRELKCFCINGQVRFIKLFVGNLTSGKKGCYYTTDWEPIPVSMSENGKMSKSMPASDKPGWLSEAIRVSEALSQPFDFVRVDLLISKDRFYYR
jgi:hypothetical protein